MIDLLSFLFGRVLNFSIPDLRLAASDNGCDN